MSTKNTLAKNQNGSSEVQSLHEGLLSEIKFAFETKSHPLSLIIAQFQSILLEQIEHFNLNVIQY